MLLVAEMTARSALWRTESRGSHFRADFPEQDDERWLQSIVVRQGGDGAAVLESRPVSLSRLRPEIAVAAGARV